MQMRRCALKGGRAPAEGRTSGWLWVWNLSADQGYERDVTLPIWLASSIFRISSRDYLQGEKASLRRAGLW
jgi:hypothetical protein